MTTYASEIGKHKDTISGLRMAAEVASHIIMRSDDLIDKAHHLAAIHKLPESAWSEQLDQNDPVVSTAEKLGKQFGVSA